MYSWMISNGTEQRYVGTEVDSWERAEWEFAIVKNTVLTCWHLVDLKSGALIATTARRREVIRLAKRSRGELTDAQREQAKEWAASAEILPAADFFVRFRQYPAR
jgi:hypothetical protein